MPEMPSASVAIVMRTKNRPVLLDRAVRDVCQQTYQDWTLVVVNDGGNPEEVESVAGRYADQTDGRLSIIHNVNSVGMEAASNLGVRASDSTYIVIHDDDDEWREDFLQATVDYLERSNDEGVMVRTEIVYERVQDDTIEELSREIFEPELSEITLFDLLRVNRGVPISFLYRRSVHERIGYYDENLPVVGDWEFHLRFAKYSSIGFLDGEPRAFWNQRRESAGDMGNSVISQQDQHRKYDLQVRDQHLREYAEKNGLGALLYLTKILDIQGQESRGRSDHSDSMVFETLEIVRGLTSRIEHLENVLNRLESPVASLDATVGRLESAVSDASIISLARRRYRRFRERMLRRRG
ncbi:glycosyltransferase family 2 protein [Arthrobacter cavernae]|uniref:Glycosyltransferase family 2 protein n=1 Tax=Arthrobacter cavernae TaxID=2817681 RepID=A0A939KIQ1_9MICC|nr:glycosyltransferase family 2 protein [Arthrobacter cavernae]MBO1266864.1 glycosyltransferase family 2 protein [Arthrobacter cavernae]